MTAPHTLILDGFLGRPWRWERLRRLVEAHAGPATIFSYDSTGRTPLPALGERLAEAVRRFGDAGVNLVGFSMGGLVIRAGHLFAPDLPTRRAVFINSPHHGTWAAGLWPWPGVRQMLPGDAFLRAIDAAPWTVPSMTVYNRFDGVIYPAHHTRWRFGGEHVCCPVPLHVWPVWSRSVHRRIADFLAAPRTAVA